MDSLFTWGKYKQVLSFPELNIYSDVAPFAETAVILNFKNGTTREDMVSKC